MKAIRIEEYAGPETLRLGNLELRDPRPGEVRVKLRTAQKLKVGTAVCLVSQHHPITLAKTIASLDRVSHRRFIFGILSD
jgi:NADPH:quinone reductase-like Zn-dependent oxidoreductase